MNQTSIASIISQRRKALGLTQQALADQLHISNKSISKWETGEGLPDISILKDLALALHISVDELLGNLPDSTPVSAPAKDKTRLIRILIRSGILVVHVLPFVSLSTQPGSILVLTFTVSGYQLLGQGSWIAVFVLTAFLVNLILLCLDLFKIPFDHPKILKSLHGSLTILAILIPISAWMTGLNLGIGLILNTVFLLSVSLSALNPFRSK